MSEQEGVIKYHLDFTEKAPVEEDIRQLNVWRSILYGLRLVGQDAQRYGGYGYGNLSVRSKKNLRHIIISASQTGHLAELNTQHYSLVTDYDIKRNKVVAVGPMPPSSEVLTHAMFYRLNNDIQCVMHIHNARLWHFAQISGYPTTAATVDYGTPQMAFEVRNLYEKKSLQVCRILVMAGHEDGVICFGNSISQAGQALLKLWVDAQA